MADCTVLMTAFEPSGDILGGTLIRGIKQRDPNIRVVAMGGPLMEKAGAELIECTTEHAAMGLDILGEIGTHLGRMKRLKAWLKNNAIDAHVPTDSPAANWGACKSVRKLHPSAKIVHLVAPQMWAWAPWRIKKMKRLSDHVMCLLPFEPDWFGSRGMPGTYVGHPMFAEDPNTDLAGLPDVGNGLGGDENQALQTPKLSLLPGSRQGEWTRNLPMMFDSLKQIQAAVPGVQALMALRTEGDLAKVRQDVPAMADYEKQHTVVCGRTEDAIAWADVAMVCSGTATLQVCARGTLQTAVYNMSKPKWQWIGRHLINTRTFTLPNIVHEWIDGTRAIDEHVLTFGDPKPPADSVLALLQDPVARDRQQAAYDRIHQQFGRVCFNDQAAETLLKQLGR